MRRAFIFGAVVMSRRGCATSTLEEKTRAPAHPRVDPRRLPSTIPGISQEDLAARIDRHQAQSEVSAEWAAKEAEDLHRREVELRRSTMDPADFESWMAEDLRVAQRHAMEAARLATMTPMERHREEQRQRRRLLRYEWYKTGLLVFIFVGSIFFLFSLFLFFN